MRVVRGVKKEEGVGIMRAVFGCDVGGKIRVWER